MNKVCGIIAPDPVIAENIKKNNGIFDRDSFIACVPYFKKGNAIDVGAHYGTWSKALCSYFDTVHAFEPVHYNICYENAPDVFMYPHGLGSKILNLAMENGVDNSGQAHVLEKTGDTQIYPLDFFNFDQIAFIKIDVEGYEYHVIKGALKTIKRCKPTLCVELNGLGKKYNCDDAVLIKLLYNIGYKLVNLVNKDYIFEHSGTTAKNY